MAEINLAFSGVWPPNPHADAHLERPRGSLVTSAFMPFFYTLILAAGAGSSYALSLSHTVEWYFLAAPPVAAIVAVLAIALMRRQ